MIKLKKDYPEKSNEIIEIMVKVNEDNGKVETTPLTKIKKDDKLTVLMDSNRKFIDFKKLFKAKEVEVIPCGSTEAANNILESRSIQSDEILVHVGTNDLETKEPNLVAKEIAKLAKKLKENCKVYISEITTRNDYLKKNVDITNALLKKELHKEIQENTITLIDHVNINSHKSLHDRKHLNKDRKGGVLSGVEQLCLDFYNQIDGSSNGKELLQSIRRENYNQYHQIHRSRYYNRNEQRNTTYNGRTQTKYNERYGSFSKEFNGRRDNIKKLY